MLLRTLQCDALPLPASAAEKGRQQRMSKGDKVVGTSKEEVLWATTATLCHRVCGVSLYSLAQIRLM